MSTFQTKMRTTTALLVLAYTLLSCGCMQEPSEAVDVKFRVDYAIRHANAKQDLEKRLLEDLNGANNRIWAAASGDVMTDKVANALVRAAEKRDVDVKVVADADDKNKKSFKKIRNSDIPITFGDGKLSYLPNPTLAQILVQCEYRKDKNKLEEICTAGDTTKSPCNDKTVSGGQGTMCRPGTFNLMSHRFFIVDERTVWNLAGGLENTGAGSLGWKADSEVVREDFVGEFKQMHAGVFSTTLDVYNGPVKSNNDSNLDYRTEEGVLQIRFNPQERLMKHVIDEVYRAKTSVDVMSPSITNPFLLDALEYKKKHGFRVRIVVGKDAQRPGESKERLKKLGARAHPADGGIPSVVVVDAKTDKNGEEPRWPRTGLALSHPMWHAQPFEVIPPKNPMSEDAADRVRVYPSDHFVDGTFWLLREYSSNKGGSPQLDQMAEFTKTAWKQADKL